MTVPSALAASETRSPALLGTIEGAKEYGRNARASATRRAYASDLRDFEDYCASNGLAALPATPQTVALYVTALAQSGRKVSTIRRRLSSISHAHRQAGVFDSPTRFFEVTEVMKGIARTLGVAPKRKAAMTIDLLRRAIATTPDTLRGKRDRAIMLLGFNLAARRSEIAALNVDDLVFSSKGLNVTIRKSKTDQEGVGAEIGIPTHGDKSIDAASAVREYLEGAGITEGPVFRTFSLRGNLQENRIDPKDVALCVQRLSAAANVEGDMAGHSLRSGFITSAAINKIGIDRISRVSRHKSVPILLGYVRRADPFDDAPQAEIS